MTMMKTITAVPIKRGCCRTPIFRSHDLRQVLWWCAVLVVLAAVLHPASAELSRETVHDDPFVVYPYRLVSTSPFGRISDNALPGSEVPVDSTLPHFDEGDDTTHYLTLQLTNNAFYVIGNNSANSSSSSGSSLPNPHKVKGKPGSNNHKPPKVSNAPWGPSSPLPDGVRIDISGEQGNIAQIDEKLAFTLDENLHIVVENSHRFKDVDGIEFWVVAIQRQKGGPDKVVSNPLSFVVKIDHNQPQRQGAPIYAGIVVVVVCLFALLIPLTVRTKRRLREGKPLCVCGSSAKTLQNRRKLTTQQEAENGSEYELRNISRGVSSSEIPGSGYELTNTAGFSSRSEIPGNGKFSGLSSFSPSSLQASGNLAVILEAGGRERADTVSKPGETLQSRNMRSVTGGSSSSRPSNFQPRWLDPHYGDRGVYDHPVFLKTPASPIATRPSFNASTSASATATMGPRVSVVQPDLHGFMASSSVTEEKTARL